MVRIMKKRYIRFRLGALAAAVCALATVVLAEPGASDDPLISKSYIENQLMPQIKQYIESRLAEVGGGSGGGTTAGTADKFNVVNASAGQQIICSAGTELILRMGSASVIATEKGGIADTTDGFDLADGAFMPSNHLLIVPVSDGRGVRATTDIIVMIKGGYTVK